MPEHIGVQCLWVIGGSLDLDQTRPHYRNESRRRASQTLEGSLDVRALIFLNIDEVHIGRGQAAINVQLTHQIRLLQAHRGDEQCAEADRYQDDFRLIARSVEAPYPLAQDE